MSAALRTLTIRSVSYTHLDVYKRQDMHTAIEKGLKAAVESDSASTWVLSNHDVPRVATRYALPQIKATRYHQIALDWLLRDGSSYDEDRELGERRARAALLLEDVYKRQPLPCGQA